MFRVWSPETSPWNGVLAGNAPLAAPTICGLNSKSVAVVSAIARPPTSRRRGNLRFGDTAVELPIPAPLARRWIEQATPTVRTLHPPLTAREGSLSARQHFARDSAP